MGRICIYQLAPLVYMLYLARAMGRIQAAEIEIEIETETEIEIETETEIGEIGKIGDMPAPSRSGPSRGRRSARARRTVSRL